MGEEYLFENEGYITDELEIILKGLGLYIE